MAESGEYKYTIEIKLNSEGSSSGESLNNSPINPGANNNPSSKSSSKGTISKFAPLLAIGHNAINFATSNVGMFTGNEKLQEEVNYGLKMIGYGGMIAINPIMGAIAVGTNYISSAITYGFNQKWKNIELEQARYKVGYSSTNRSR